MGSCYKLHFLFWLFLFVLVGFGFLLFAFLSCTVTGQWMFDPFKFPFVCIVIMTDVATALIRWICKMQLSSWLDKRPGESRLALDGRKKIHTAFSGWESGLQFFLQTTFIQTVVHLMQLTTFQSCRYGSRRQKRPCWASMFQNFRSSKWCVRECLYRTAMKGEAWAKEQPKASRLPPLIPHFASRISLTGFREDLPSLEVIQKVQTAVPITTNMPSHFPKAQNFCN